MARQTSASVYRTILTQILDNTLQDGSRLPTERKLANEFGASRSTIRKAIDRLRQDGLVLSRQGDGNYVAGLRAEDPLALRVDLDGSFDDVFAVRRLIDGQLAADAAQNNGEITLRRLSDSIAMFQREIEAASIDMLNIRRADIEFHGAIADASGNRMLRELVRCFAPAVVPYWRAWMELEQSQMRKLVADTLAEHTMIYSAIEAGNPQIAEAAMRHHFQTNHVRYRRLFRKARRS